MSKYIRKTAVLAVGWGMVGVGFIGLFTPFLQGILLLVLGIYLLSLESVYFKKAVDKITARFPRAARYHKAVEDTYRRIFVR